MSDLSELPELGDLIPRVPGNVYEFNGLYWVGGEHVRAANSEEGEPVIGRKGDLIRVGFKLYEITGYSSFQSAYELRPFRATLSQPELMKLSGQA